MVNFLKSRPIFNLRGGTGNQLFIYSAGNFLCSQIGVAPIFNPGGIGNNECISELMIPGTFLNRVEVKIGNIERRIPQIITQRKNLDLTLPIGFSDYRLRVPKRSDVSGYFQDSFFANFCLSRGDFAKLQAEPFSGQLREKFDEIKSNEGTVVHLRFGDYLNGSKTLGNLSPKYYHKVIQSDSKISQSRIYVMSDDYSLAKEYFQDFRGLDLHYLDTISQKKNHDLLSLFGAATHIICANSTFSWWGAFLSTNAKSVYAPTPWFKSPLFQSQINETFYPSNFKKVSSDWQG
jgi:hypothetical protein